MPDANWDRIQELFLDAADLPPLERAAFLDRNCAGQPALRAEVESLLAADRSSGNSTMRPVASAIREAAGVMLDGSMVGRRLGPWLLVREIGRGGMGSVFLATRDDEQFHKEVALKLIRHGMDTEDVLSRFRQERQILASLDHPYIARLLDAGTAPDGRPFFVMEYVVGQSLDEYCESRQLSIRQRCDLFLKVCEAVAYAHRKLVIHRDLKPANILVSPDQNGEPAPKLLDFGVAKLLDPADAKSGQRTSLEQRAMTPQYASPEQVRAEPMTTSTDVYSLGAILYELLSGVRAHNLSSTASRDVERVICEVEPPKPSEATPTRRTQLQGDLDAIVGMAMRKEAELRYLSVEALAADVRNYLGARPVWARQGDFTYRATRYLRRHRVSLSVGLMLFLALAGGAAVSTWQAIRAAREQALAEHERLLAVASEARARASQERALASQRDAEKQATEAELQRVFAETQRQLANRRFEQVRQLAGKFLLDFHDSIARLPGSTPARKMVVETGLRYYDTLVRDAGGNPELLKEIARGYDRLGDVQGNPYYANLGDISGALTSYRKAYQIRSGLPDTSPAFLYDRIMGNVRLTQLTIPRAEYKAGVEYAKAALAFRMPEAAARSFEVRDARANAWGILGDVYLRMGDYVATVEPYVRQLELRTELARDNPDQKAGLRGISVANTKLADDYYRLGQSSKAYTHILVALPIDKGLVDSDPTNMNLVRKLYVTYLLLGSVLSAPTGRHLAKPEEVTGYYDSALALADRMVAVDPDNRQPLLDTSIACDNYGDWLRTLKKPDAALIVYRKAASTVEHMNRLSPEAPGNRGMLIEVYERLGLALTDLKQFQEAEENLRTSEKYLQLAEARNPGIPVVLARRLEFLQARGDLFFARAQWPQAIETYVQAVALMERMHREIPDNDSYINDQPALFASLARSYENAGQRPDALRAMNTALQRFRELEAKRALVAGEVEEKQSAQAALAQWSQRHE